jgi:hypothetical protein
VSSITRKKKICSVCGGEEFLFSHGKCRRCWEITRSKSTNSVNEEDLSDLIADADAVFSKFVRMNERDIHGDARCYTCGSQKRWQEQQCGHYVSRSNYLLRWDLRNVKVQCSDCNCGKHGNLGQYTARLEYEFPGLPTILIDEARIVYKPSREEIRGIVSEYTRKIEMLKMES